MLSPSSQTQQLLADVPADLPGLALQAQQLAALELLMQGALAPLRGFSIATDPLQTDLPLRTPARLRGPTETVAVAIGMQMALQDSEGVTLAILTVEQLQPDGESEGVLLGGPVSAVQLPQSELFKHYRTSPQELRNTLAQSVAGPALCIHVRGELGDSANAQLAAHSPTAPVLLRVLDSGNPDHAHQIKHTLSAMRRLREQIGADRCTIAVSPDPSPQAGAFQQALDERFAEFVGCAANIWPHAPDQRARHAGSGTCIFFTGLSGSGKSTLARALHANLIHHTEHAVTLLDGDVVRQHLSKGLGFSRTDRDVNVRRIGYVASRVVMHGGLVICAAIAPYAKARAQVREMIEQHGQFLEVHVSTPLAVCEQRDIKGLYAQARAGNLKEFTGVSDPYEAPADAEFVIDTDVTPINDAVAQISTAIVDNPGEPEPV